MSGSRLPLFSPAKCQNALPGNSSIVLVALVECVMDLTPRVAVTPRRTPGTTKKCAAKYLLRKNEDSKHARDPEYTWPGNL